MSDILYKIKEYYITIIFLILNIAVYLSYTFAGEIVYNIGCLDAGLIINQREYYRIFSCMFLHMDIEHIVGNMIFLVALGQMLETAIGHIRFLAVYLFSGICGSILSLIYMLLTAHYYTSIGASGAVFGLVGALLFLVVINNGRYAGISLPRILFAIVYMLYSGYSSPQVDNSAHIGGLIAGMLAMLIIYFIGKNKRVRCM